VTPSKVRFTSKEENDKEGDKVGVLGVFAVEKIPEEHLG